jgi:hypothetical protein
VKFLLHPTILKFSLLGLVIVFSGCRKQAYLEQDTSSVGLVGSRTNVNGPVYQKSNLELLILGKNRWEVTDLLGEPNGKSLNLKNEHVWDYRKSVIHDETGEIFDWTLITVTFTVGKCSSIELKYQSPPSVLVDPGF